MPKRNDRVDVETRRSRSWVRMLSFLAPAVILIVAACTPSEAALLEGVLQNVDSANGEITIVTKDGRTITLTIRTDATVESDGVTLSLEALEPGVSVELDVDDDEREVHEVKAHVAKVEGRIEAVGDSSIAIRTEHGRLVELEVTDGTRIKLEDDLPGTLADLVPGTEVEVKFDPETLVAFKIDAEHEDAEIEGVLVEVSGDSITVRTEYGRRLTLSIDDATRIELDDDDVPGTLIDLAVAKQVEVKFDPFELRAFKIEIEDYKDAEIEGALVEVNGDSITVLTDHGRRLTLSIDDATKIELDDHERGTLIDLAVAKEVEVKFDPFELRALKIEIENGDERDDGHEHANDEGLEVEGVVLSVDDSEIILRTKRGEDLTFTITHDTRIELDDDALGTLSDIHVGEKVEVDYDPETNQALLIETDK
ncbi:MAG: hypothetical protein IIC82_09380 [Chloroflexi bacterium]|nr:hypothetical protein [Chloroflexota bacterium]